MIVVSLLTEPVTIDLSSIYPGVKVTIRRLTSPELSEARDATVAILRQAREGLAALKPYGLNEADAGGRRLNPMDADEMARAGLLVGHVEIAMRALISWEGVCVAPPAAKRSARRPLKLKPAPIDRATLSVLLQDDAFSRRLMLEVEAASRVIVTEGNDFGPSPGGSSAIRPATMAGQATATVAEASESPAPRGSPVAPAATVPRSRTRPSPQKPRGSGGS